MSAPMHPSGGPHYRPGGGEPQEPDPQRKERHLLAIAAVGIALLVIVLLVFLPG